MEQRPARIRLRLCGADSNRDAVLHDHLITDGLEKPVEAAIERACRLREFERKANIALGERLAKSLEPGDSSVEHEATMVLVLMQNLWFRSVVLDDFVGLIFCNKAVGSGLFRRVSNDEKLACLRDFGLGSAMNSS